MGRALLVAGLLVLASGCCSDMICASQIAGVATDGDRLYWLDVGNGQVSSADFSGNDQKRLSTSRKNFVYSPGPLFATSSYVYWQDGGELHRVSSATGGTSDIIATDAWILVVDDSGIYNFSPCDASLSAFSLVRSSLDATDPQVIVPCGVSQRPFGMSSDANALYWSSIVFSDSGPISTISMVPKSGGAPEVLVSDANTTVYDNFAIWNGSVYWQSVGFTLKSVSIAPPHTIGSSTSPNTGRPFSGPSGLFWVEDVGSSTRNLNQLGSDGVVKTLRSSVPEIGYIVEGGQYVFVAESNQNDVANRINRIDLGSAH